VALFRAAIPHAKGHRKMQSRPAMLTRCHDCVMTHHWAVFNITSLAAGWRFAGSVE
jgi:hypothetical protein